MKAPTKAAAAMKVAKEMKAMKAMKVKNVMKKVSARLAKRHVFLGKASKTSGGLTKGGLVRSKTGKIVSKKASDKAKKSPWIKACAAARAALKIKGFAVIKKGSPLYKKAKELYGFVADLWTLRCTQVRSGV